MINPYHPDYGIPHQVRASVVQDLTDKTVREVAITRRFSQSSVYRWRKALKTEETNQ